MRLCKWCRAKIRPFDTTKRGYLEEPCEFCGCRMMVLPEDVSYGDVRRLEMVYYLKPWDEEEIFE